ncbi:adaptive-response sensory-kinase [Haloferax larsenii JCM 13917]|nr:ATP-binding protein [Haloferax larsenii]ELZ77981.1 adaptive-response sensory-kinase [Haloferax larsenii JCM 13917]
MARTGRTGEPDGVEPTVLFVAPSPSLAEAASAALERQGVAVSVEYDLGVTIERLREQDADCLVAPTPIAGLTATELVEIVRERNIAVPLVLLVSEADEDRVAELEEADGADYVLADVDSVSYGRLADRIRAAVAKYHSSRAQQSERDIVSRLEHRIQRTERKITSLHGVAMELSSASTVDDIYEQTVDAAEQILDLDICFAFEAEADRFVPRAKSSTPTDRALEPVPLDAGVMGETYRTGDSHRAVDMDLHALAEPEFGEYRSGLSVAIGSFGVFQAVSKQTGAFDEIDLELTELLVAHTTAALQRLEYQQQLRVERDQFAALFDNSTDCIVEATFDDGEPIVQAVNPAFEETFGYDESEVVGVPIDDIVAPDERHEEAVQLTRQVRAGDYVQTEVRRQTNDGEKDFLLRSVPLSDDAMYAVYTDITERRDLQRGVEAQNERLEEFVSVISHDLRNPLNVAQGRLDLAREETDNEHLQAVSRSLDRMADLTDELLEFAREGAAALDPEPTNLETVAHRSWEHVDTAEATLDVDADLTIDADEGRLQQLFENLFRNSVEHAADDVTITVGTLDTGTGFFVEDDGPGIPAEIRTEVFDAGFSTAEMGSGFGLTIVASVAEAHEWNVEICEGDAGGARFEFTLYRGEDVNSVAE